MKSVMNRKSGGTSKQKQGEQKLGVGVKKKEWIEWVKKGDD